MSWVHIKIFRYFLDYPKMLHSLLILGQNTTNHHFSGKAQIFGCDNDGAITLQINPDIP